MHPARSLDLIDFTCNGHPAVAIYFNGQEVATIHDLRRRFGNGLLRPNPQLLMNPAPEGRRWTLPLPETIDLLEGVCNRLGLQNESFEPDVCGTYDDQGHFVKICFGKRQWGEVRRFEDGERITIAEDQAGGALPLLEVKSSLRRALLVSHSADPWVPADVTMDDFKVVEISIGVKILVRGEKWIEVARRAKSGLWMKMFSRSNCRPWTMPYEVVVAMLVEVRSKLAINLDDRVLDETKGRFESCVCSLPEREWLAVMIIDNALGMDWAEINQDGSDLQIQMYVWDDFHCLELPLKQVIDHLRDAKVALLDTADRPPVRRPLVASLDRSRMELARDAECRAEDTTFAVRRTPSGLALFYGDHLFANLPCGTSPTLEVEAPPGGGGWALPLPATMGALGELLTHAGHEEADAKLGEDIVFCARMAGGGTAAAIRFRGGLRAEMRQYGSETGETQIHIGLGESDPKAWRLSLTQTIATLRWALAMLHAAEPWSETKVTAEDFATVPHEDGLDLLVAGDAWIKVRLGDAQVRMEFVGRADMRPWILPYEPVITALVNVEKMALAEAKTPSGTVFADDENVEPNERLKTLRQWESDAPDRAGPVVGYYFRDEDCWVQWAEVNQGGREPQIEFYSWPGCRRFLFPIREVIDRLGEAKKVFSSNG